MSSPQEQLLFFSTSVMRRRFASQSDSKNAFAVELHENQHMPQRFSLIPRRPEIAFVRNPVKGSACNFPLGAAPDGQNDAAAPAASGGTILFPLGGDKVHKSIKFLFSLAPPRGEGVRG
jgi:hypothetical protein